MESITEPTPPPRRTHDRDRRLADVSVPYIGGGYAWDDARKLRELPSMIENDGYSINCAPMDLLVAAYDPDGRHAEDPLGAELIFRQALPAERRAAIADIRAFVDRLAVDHV